jgi:plasmid stability protein
MMPFMRTTLTLEDDIAKQLQERARRSGESFKEVVNETLRRGLRGEKPAAQVPRFVVKAKAGGFRRGVDVLHLNQLNDELEIEGFHRKLGTGSTKP